MSDKHVHKAFIADEVITRKLLKPFTKRTNRHGIINFTGHMSFLAATSVLVNFSLGSWYIIPAMAAHGIIMAFLFAPVHECSHGTPFRSRWLNELVYWIVCLIYIVPPVFFRYAHAAHHTYTQIRGSDPDMVLPRRASIFDYISYISAVPFWTRNIGWFIRHASGSIHPSQQYYLPENENHRVIHEARIILALYVAIGAGAFYLGSWAPLTYWIVPRLIGEPVMRWIRIAEHAECAEGGDLSKNTRTTVAPAWMRFIFWNMPYHSEHHLSPIVPFHALPRFHEEVKEYLHPIGESYSQVHVKVIKNLANKQGVTWVEDGALTNHQ